MFSTDSLFEKFAFEIENIKEGKACSYSAAGVPAPPLLLGGLNGHCEAESEIGLDWLTITFPFEKLESLVWYLGEMLGTSEIYEYGRNGYNCSIVFPNSGVSVLFDRTSEQCNTVHSGRCCAIMPGTFFKLIDGEAVKKLVDDFIQYFECNCSRIDLAWDDFKKRKYPHEIVSECIEGNFSGYKVWQPQERFKLENGENVRVSDGITFGVRGKNGGGKFLRIYDKNLESDGERDCIRWEVEFSKDKSNEVFAVLASADSLPEFGAFIASIVGGSIKFIDRKGTKLSRMKTLDWWADIINLLGVAQLRTPKRIVTVEKSKAYIENQVSTSLAMMREVMGREGYLDWLIELSRSGEVRMCSKQREALKLFQLQNEIEVGQFFDGVGA